MHYYQFNIGDYASHTSHLDDMEDLAYRRMIDYCYLNECGLPETIEHIARVIRMRTHSESIANVLREFFYLAEDGTYQQKRINDDISAYREKSEKAKQSARKRWENANANALRTQCEGNANHKPLTINQEPTTTSESDAPPANCPHHEIVELYHEKCPALPRVKMLTETRKRQLRARWRSSEKHQDIDFWKKYFDYINESAFMRGENNRGWVADFDFVIKEANFTKIIEGKYHREQA